MEQMIKIYLIHGWEGNSQNYNKVKKSSKKITAIFSDNDHYVSLSNAKVFKEKLGAKIIIKENEEHFNDSKEIREIFNFIK